MHRLVLQVTVIQLAEAIKDTNIFSLDIGPAKTTKVHNQRFNNIDDLAVEALTALIKVPHLRSLILGRTTLSPSVLETIREAVLSSSNLVYFKVHRVEVQHDLNSDTNSKDSKAFSAPFCPLTLRQTLMKNVQKFYPQYENYPSFEYGEDWRFLRSTKDVRMIDSMYRTRDQRMDLEIDPIWPVDVETWKLVEEDARQEVWKDCVVTSWWKDDKPNGEETSAQLVR